MPLVFQLNRRKRLKLRINREEEEPIDTTGYEPGQYSQCTLTGRQPARISRGPVTRVNGFEQRAFIVLMKWCLKPEVDSNNALAPYLISPENVNLRACENIRGIWTRHITTTLDAEHNTTTASVQGNHTQRSVLPRCGFRSALCGWLMRVR